MTIKVGDKLPNATISQATAEGPRPIQTDDLFKGKTVALFALPGAFTPTCSAKHLPGFKQLAPELKAKGVDVAEYSGPSSRYTITKNGDVFTITDSKGAAGDGTDTLTNVEVLRFSDGEKNLMVVKTAQTNYTPGSSSSTITGYNWNGTDLADTITTQPTGASAYRDWVTAGAGDDVITTGGAGDWIDAGEGNDTIDGGDNGTSSNTWENQDQVRYDAPMARFTITAGQDTDGKKFRNQAPRSPKGVFFIGGWGPGHPLH